MARKNFFSLFFLLIFGAGVFFSQEKAAAFFASQYPPVTSLIISDKILADVGAIAIGARKVAGDIAYIQFLQYFGVFENAKGEVVPIPHVHHENDGHDHEAHAEGFRLRRMGLNEDFSKRDKGVFIDPLLKDGQDYFSPVKISERQSPQYQTLFYRGTRTLRLNPFFNVGHLEVAGALAFSLKRSGEAARFLEEAIQRDPDFYRYRLYLAAVLFRGSGQDLKLLEILDEAIKFPDCPPLLESILGNLHEKYGNTKRAVEVYAHILNTAIQEKDLEYAQKRLVRVLRENPSLEGYALSLLEN